MLGYQLNALLWKNFLLQLRSWKSLLVEICIPSFIFLLIVYIFTKKEIIIKSITAVTAMEIKQSVVCKILYKPHSPVIAELINDGSDRTTPTFVPVKSFQNITEYEKLEKGSRFQPGCWRKVEFDLQGNEKAVPTNLRFKVVLNNQYVTDPIYVHVTISLGSEFESDSDYRDQEVSQVQYVVTKMFINYWQKKRKTNKFVATEAFYTSSLPERITISPRNQALSALDAFFPFLYIGLAVFAGSYVVEEKESRLKEAMKLMGLKTFSFWFSWFLTSFKTGFFICLLFMIFLKWTGYTNGNILSSSSGWILLFMIIYAIDAISFSFMLTCFINKARNFVICAVALYFSLTLGAPILSTYLCGKVSAHVGGLLFFQFAAQHFKTMFINFEWREVGVISEKLNVYEVLPYLHFIDTLIMFITNTLFNCIIIWYVSNIFPEEYGVPQPYNFFLKKSYWCPPTESEESIPALSGMDERYFQQASKNLTPGIQIRGLIKVFDKKVVVAGIDLDLFEDQITVLLGHNGAGKTTTINMLTGFLKPTKGTAIVNGIDLTKNLTKARENFGLCPQHDILFSRLTCNEHLSFYSQLRNQYHRTRTAEEAEDLLKALHIYDHRTSYSQVLSGGQKRKLSVACAFIGNTKCIFLDEPSSGLDPSARRELWDFLKTKQKGRTILLTTHYMDEADVLGDRIVIMAEGVIKCCGTPNFLKRIYGTGYQLTIEKKPDCSVKKVTSMIQSHIPEGRYMQETPTEIFYILPDEEVPLYSRLLFEMEKDKVELKISTFGLTATSLEDVFIRVGEGFEPNRFEVKPPAHRMTVDYMALHASHHRESSVDCEPLFDMTATNRASIPGVVPIEDKTASNQAGSEEVKRVDTPTEPETETNLSVKVGSDTIQVIKSKQSLRSSVETIEIFEHMTNYTKLERIQLFIQQAKAIYFKKFLLFRRSWGTSLFLILLPMFLTLLGINQRLGSQRKAKSPDLLFTVKRFPPDLRYLVFYKSDDFHQVSDHYRIMIMEKKGVVEHFDLEPDDTTENVTAILHGLMDKIGYIMFREKYLFGLIEMKHLQDPYSSKPTRVPAAIVLYQRRIPHGENIATQLALDAWVRSALGSEFSVQAGLRDYSTSASSESFGGGEFMITLLCITFSVVLVPVMMMFSLTQERAIGSKHLQDLTGVNPVAYWLATYIFDSSVYLLIVMLIVVSLQQEPVIYDNQTRGFVMYIVLMIYGQSFFPYLYALQFYFENPTKASITLMMASLLIGFTAFFSIETSLKSLSDWGVVYFMHILIILLAPCYLLLMSGFLTFWIYHRQDEQEDPPSLLQFLRYRDRGRSILNALIEMAVLAVLAWAVLFLIEFRIYRLIRYKLMPYLNPETPKDSDNFKEDDDVIQERQLIYTTDKATLFLRNALVLEDVHKCFFSGISCKPFVAVYNTCLGVTRKECLGLLGQNGAGKTTTFRIITGREVITSGNVYVEGLSVKTSFQSIKSFLGYCPQEDALHDTLTGRETLYLYARIRGVPEKSLKSVVQAVVDFISLGPHVDRISKYYSGGNKRKLSLGISVIGNPKLIVLDEPTAGMDPVARRKLWDVLHLIRASGKTLVLTSHSMEECEALCTRIAIMVHGRIMCLGSLQHLKSKYGQGYTVVLHASKNPDVEEKLFDDAKQHILTTLKDSKLFSEQEGYADLHVPETTPLFFIFQTLEDAKTRFSFEHYTVEQNSLEQIFLRILKMKETHQM